MHLTGAAEDRGLLWRALTSALLLLLGNFGAKIKGFGVFSVPQLLRCDQSADFWLLS